MRRLLAVGTLLFGCAGGPPLDVPEEAPPAEALAPTKSDGPAQVEHAIEKLHVLERCLTCGPVPDPWDEVRGPVPDPWVPPADPNRP
jgi:hypothetical protein